MLRVALLLDCYSVCKGLYVAVKDAKGCKLSWEHFHYFAVFEFLQVKLDARALREVLGFQLQLDGCNVSTRL